jgi:polyhydroxyalkanoate synthase
LTTLLDFSDTGVLDVFVDEMQVALREQSIGRKGIMPGRDLASTFSSLRANDLVWSYVQSNYLKGRHRRLIFCIGTRTALICRDQCFAGI